MNKQLKQALACAALVAMTSTIAPAAALADGNAPTPIPPVTAQPTAPATIPPVTAQPTAPATGSVTGELYGGAAPDPAANLPTVSVTPDSLFYGLKIFFEKLDLFFTLSATNKAQTLLDQSQQRLAEARAAVTAGNQAAASEALTRYNATMADAARVTQQAAAAHKDITKLEAKLETTSPAWATVMAQLVAATPEADRQKLIEKLAPALLEMAKVETAGKAKAPATPGDAKQSNDEDDAAHRAQLNLDVLKQLTADQTAVGLQMQAAKVNPKTILELSALAKLSGKPLADVYVLYVQNHGIGKLAGLLGVRTPDVMKSAQAQSKGAVIAIKGANQDEDESQDDAKREPGQYQQQQATKTEHGTSNDEHGKNNEEHGKGHGKSEQKANVRLPGITFKLDTKEKHGHDD